MSKDEQNISTEEHKEFALSTLSVNNRKTVWLIAVLILFMGLSAYIGMPKENFPELVIPEIYVGTPYPGGSPEYIEDKVTQPFEKEFNSIKGVKEISSTSIYGYSSVKIEFEFSISVEEAKRKVQDAIKDARAKPEFPELQLEPMVQEVDFADMPVMNINLSGDYTSDKLKEYGELLEDRIEALQEVNEVDIRGIQEKKLKVEINKYAAEARNVSFNDIIGKIQSENRDTPGGEIIIGSKKRSVRIEGEFQSPEELANIIIKSEDGGNQIKLKEVADVSFGDADMTSYARQFGKPVVMLDIKKRSGENLLDAAAKIKQIVAERAGIPSGVEISVTNDQSSNTKNMVSNLENSIIFGVILVVLVLMFFLGLRNALFVGVAIPLSMFMSFMILSSMGVTLNVMVLFSLVLALGMLVDNGIVVVENVYRLMDEGMDRFEATKKGVGEVAWPIIASTATTLAAFVPLALWPGIMGEFMKYLPITLIIVLGSSLFVALVINPVFIAVFMKLKEPEKNMKKVFRNVIIMFVVGMLMIVGGVIWLGNLLVLFAILTLVNIYLFTPWTKNFQEKFLPIVENFYEKFLKGAVAKPRRVWLGMLAVFILTIMVMNILPPKVLFFPENDPLYVNVYIETPIGTSIQETDNVTKEIASIIDKEVVQKHKDHYKLKTIELEDGSKRVDTVNIISSLLEQVGEGTSDPASGQVAGGSTPHKARIALQFADFEDRNGISTSDIMTEVKEAVKGKFTADISIVVDKNQNGPPQEPPVNIEIYGPDKYENTIEWAEKVKKFMANKNVKGVDKLRLDVETGKPEVLIEIDRNKAIRFGLSTSQIASQIRTAVFGSDVSTYKVGDETYDVNVRLAEDKRNDLDEILDQKITFRNNKGKLLNIPIRSMLRGEPKELSSYGSVVRKDQNQMVTVYSTVDPNSNPNEVVDILKGHLEEYYETTDGKAMQDAGYTATFTGQMEEQAKEMSFLSGALLFAVFLILFIIVAQFNSFSAPAIILTAVVLSLLGVFLGLSLSGMDFVIIMTMIGIISLAGVVVNNAIVLIDYTNLIQDRRKKELGLKKEEWLPMEDVIKAIVEGGKTRLRPVLLTAITTILGLLPLATGLNIDFVNLIADYSPNISVGGDNVMFFGPMSWAIIFGLTFATFLTLVLVPVMYLWLYRIKLRIYGPKDESDPISDDELLESTLLD